MKILTQSEEVLTGLRRILKSTLIYNPELKVFSSEKDDVGENFFPKRIFNYIVEHSNDNVGENKELQRLNNLNKYIVFFPGLQEFFLENFKGYKRLR